MKRLMMHSVFAAAALVAVAGSASAQNLKAEIPFSFRAGGVLMPPGSYEVAPMRSLVSRPFTLRNRESHASVIALYAAQNDPSKAWVLGRAPKISFECAYGRCALKQIWTGDGPAYSFPADKAVAEGADRVTEVRVISMKAD